MKKIQIFLILSSFFQVTTAQYSPYQVQQELMDTRHPIDIKYEGKLEFRGTNTEMERNIQSATKDWWALIEEKKSELTAGLEGEKRALFLNAQTKWEQAYKADKRFFFSSSTFLRQNVGREGEIGCQLEFMNRVRKRALDLSEYANLFLVKE